MLPAREGCWEKGGGQKEETGGEGDAKLFQPSASQGNVGS